MSTVKCIRQNGRVLCANVNVKQTNKLLLLLLCLTMKFSIHSGNKNKTKNLVGRVLNFKFKNMKLRRGKKKNNHTIRTLHTRNTHNNKQINKIPTKDKTQCRFVFYFLLFKEENIAKFGCCWRSNDSALHSRTSSTIKLKVYTTPSPPE